MIVGDAHLDEVTLEFFATDTARDAVHKKVTAMFPEHEVEEFTELFWERIQSWRADEPGSGDAGFVRPDDTGAGNASRRSRAGSDA